jgi:transcriptional regulator with XRE-family HTH domain
MDDARLGRLVRVLRHRRGWRQVDLAQRAGVGRSVVSDLEFGRLDAMRVATIRKIVAPFGLTFGGALRGLGADADRLLDERHAALMGACAEWLGRLGWRSVSEVSYSEWGERGSVDLLAWHESTANLLVVEIKTELASVEATLRKHDEKVRLAPSVAAGRFGWRPASVGRLLIFPEDRTERRRVAEHASVMDGAYPMRSREVRAWCRSPSGPMAGLMFLTDSASSRRTVGRGRRERVRESAGKRG